ncbi:MAG: hypothetical protein JJU05_19115 [Verrucomicrobia bacterium]|nr:hypothetical protein [Verrucomicrobiota bacterium]
MQVDAAEVPLILSLGGVISGQPHSQILYPGLNLLPEHVFALEDLTDAGLSLYPVDSEVSPLKGAAFYWRDASSIGSVSAPAFLFESDDHLPAVLDVRFVANPLRVRLTVQLADPSAPIAFEVLDLEPGQEIADPAEWYAWTPAETAGDGNLVYVEDAPPMEPGLRLYRVSGVNGGSEESGQAEKDSEVTETGEASDSGDASEEQNRVSGASAGETEAAAGFSGTAPLFEPSSTPPGTSASGTSAPVQFTVFTPLR